MTVFAFGPRWTSALVKDAEWVDTPVGRACVSCAAIIGNVDQGLFVGYHTDDVNEAEPIHLTCFSLRAVRGATPNVDLDCLGAPPLTVVLAAIDHALSHSGYSPDAHLAFTKLCERLNVNENSLRYERGWAKKYIT